MIEYPPGSGWYVMVVGPQQGADISRPITSEEMAQWDLEAEWINMVYGSDNDF